MSELSQKLYYRRNGAVYSMGWVILVWGERGLMSLDGFVV
jgi:hypothetical protein